MFLTKPGLQLHKPPFVPEGAHGEQSRACLRAGGVRVNNSTSPHRLFAMQRTFSPSMIIFTSELGVKMFELVVFTKSEGSPFINQISSRRVTATTRLTGMKGEEPQPWYDPVTSV